MMVEKMKRVEDVKHQIWLAEKRLESLKTELKALDGNTLTAGKCRLKLVLQDRGRGLKEYWSLGVRGQNSSGKESYISIFASQDKQAVLNAMKIIISDMIELEKRIAAQMENMKEEEG